MNTSTTAINQEYKNYPDTVDLPNIPGNYGLPIIGHMVDFVKDLRGMVDNNIKKYGTVSKLNIMGNKGVLVAGPETMQEVLLDKGRNYSNEMGFRNTLGKFFEGGILLKDFGGFSQAPGSI